MMTTRKPTTATIETARIKARIHYHTGRVTMLCPNGHVVAQVVIDAQFAGSNAQMNMTARTHGESNAYDRLAQACAIQDAAERYAATLI